MAHRWLLAPAIIAITLLLLVPLLFTVLLSLGILNVGNSENTAGTGAWQSVLGDGFYWWFLVKTLLVAGVSTLVAALLGYPPAYFLATSRSRWRPLLLLLIVLPFWISYIIRTMSWINVLGASGAINEAAMGLGLIDTPWPLLYNQVSVIVGLVHFILPFMILNIYVALDGLDESLPGAAKSLGASSWQAFCRVTLPLSVPGLAAGSLICFLLAAGSYVTPIILGGPKDAMFANLIYEAMIIQLDWRTGAVLALLLLGALGMVTAIAARFLGLERIGRAAA
ncbi:ABC transporter permease [Alteraurantiacibacter aestuarii]|uniref:ABC transporter permease n=1 Tax=Alteraurantiacibacter aestuarii TaxID=650004 RepID=UPI001925E271|nr:ABC transporter permease [Alteraurantiacibacter aestuarii]